MHTTVQCTYINDTCGMFVTKNACTVAFTSILHSYKLCACLIIDLYFQFSNEHSKRFDFLHRIILLIRFSIRVFQCQIRFHFIIITKLSTNQDSHVCNIYRKRLTLIVFFSIQYQYEVYFVINDEKILIYVCIL